ncbi:MAG: DnaJ domain-containing protein, partial [Deltaproteobacteria bacterium]|nr:DnaJ domain-containing protein [Deltaproteobacteria bacterium]
MASRKDYYDILGIRRGATPEEIEKAFQKLTRTYQFIPNP